MAAASAIKMQRRRIVLALIPALLMAASCGRKAEDRELVVAAATSLRKTVPALIDGFRQTEGQTAARLTATYGASGELARQVEGGAGVDVVVFAAKDPIDRLVQGGLVEGLTTRVVATNELVLIGKVGGPKLTFETVTSLPAGERIAIGDPGAVPAGRYAREALTRLG